MGGVSLASVHNEKPRSGGGRSAMRGRAVADVIRLAGLERVALAILQFDVQRSAEAENHVAFRAPVVGDVTDGILDHAKTNLAEIPRLPPRHPGCTRMF